MQVLDTSSDQLSTHIRDQSFSDIANCRIVVLDRLKGLHPLRRHFNLGPAGSTNERGVCLNGHDTGNDGYSDALGAALLQPFDEVLRIVEHLGDHKRAASINLLLQVVDQLVHIGVVIGTLGIATHTNIEVVAILDRKSVV